ncbi:MAG TPA: hypothetical protein EYP71_03380, partial [Dehalococcoidia bacterium]|nr:hypothetical protein [Dehalococcoidia bacterium]
MVRGKVIVILLLASLLISPLGTSPVSAADGEETQGVLPDAVVAELLQNCDPEAIAQVYQEYTQKLTAEVSPAPVKVVPRSMVIEKEAPLAAEVVTQAGIEQLKREIAAIVEQCFTRELGNLRCPDAPCAAAAYLQQAARLKSGYLDNPALPAPREELGMQLPLVVKKCLHKLLEDCNCDVACLECLLQAVGSDAAYADLVAQIRDKLERCRETEPTRQPVAPSLPPAEEACRRLEQLLGEAREKAVQKAEQEGKAERIAGIETDFDRLEKLLGEALQRATAEEVAPVETEIVELKLSGTSPLGPVELTLPVDRVNVSVFERLTETTDTQVRLIW